MKPKAQRNITATVITSVFVLLSLVGLGIWIAPNQTRAPNTVAQPKPTDPSTVPASFPIEPSAIPVTVLPVADAIQTVEASPMPTYDPNKQVFQPTATATQKEVVIFDSFNNITVTLQSGLFVKIPTEKTPLVIRNFDVTEAMERPKGWVAANVGIGRLPSESSFEKYVTEQHIQETDLSTSSNTKVSEVEPFILGKYEGFKYEIIGDAMDAEFMKITILYLKLDANNVAGVQIYNSDMPDAKIIFQTLETLTFSPTK